MDGVAWRRRWRSDGQRAGDVVGCQACQRLDRIGQRALGRHAIDAAVGLERGGDRLLFVAARVQGRRGRDRVSAVNYDGVVAVVA